MHSNGDAIHSLQDKPKERAFWERKQEALETLDAAAYTGTEGGTEDGTRGGVRDGRGQQREWQREQQARDALGVVPTHTWLPHQLRIRVGSDGDVIITQTLEPAPAIPPPTADTSGDSPENEVRGGHVYVCVCVFVDF